jgi:peptidoglycan-associated lipoprotein
MLLNLTKYLFNKTSIMMMLITALSATLLISGCARKTGAVKNQKQDETQAQPAKVEPSVQPAPVEQTSQNPSVQDENANAQETEKPVTVTSSAIRTVHFAFDKYDLSDEAREILKKNAQWLKDNQNVKVIVEGHCDDRGTVEYNLALGEKRAKAVKDYYISLGIPANRIQTISYGEERPANPAENEAAWAQNRRSETNILK